MHRTRRLVAVLTLAGGLGLTGCGDAGLDSDLPVTNEETDAGPSEDSGGPEEDGDTGNEEAGSGTGEGDEEVDSGPDTTSDEGAAAD